MSGEPQILTSLTEGVLEIRISRPEKKNALTAAMYSALTEAFKAASGNRDVKVVLLRGSQGVFTSGNDLGDFLNNPPRDADAPVFRFIETLVFFDKPLVAAVDGLAVGIGTTLLLHCDLVYADAGTRFLLPFVNLGLCPEAASSYLLPQRAGHARAAELLLLGQPFSAAFAKEAGLVNAVVTDGKVHEQAEAACRSLVEKPAAAVRAIKGLLRQPQEADLREVLENERRSFLKRLESPEAREAFSAFAEKRKPDFTRFE